MQKDLKPSDNNKKEAGPNDYLANERTFLAWIRTSIAIMGFGFVVVKFSLFINQISLLLHGKEHPAPPAHSPIIGVFLVVVGAAVVILSFIQYKRTERKLANHTFRPSTRLASTVMLLLLAICVLLIVYLIISI